MPQHDFNIANQTFPETRTDLNNAFAAMVAQSSGGSAPSTTFAYQFWYDTSTNILKIRNADNDAFISLFTFNQTNDTIASIDGRDIAVDGTKLDTIETNADVTDTANVTSAGALMRTGGAMTGAITTNSTFDGRDVSVDGSKLDNITVTQAVNLDTMEQELAALQNGMVYHGDWDASAGSFPGGGSAQVGWFYFVSVAGTVDSVAFAVGDNIVALTDNASTGTFSGNWSKHDQTDAVQAVVGLTGSVAKGSLLSALNVEDGADVTDTTNVTAAGALMRSGGAMTGAITTASNANIDLLPNGSGKVNLDGNGSSGGVAVSDGLVDIRTGTGTRAQVKFYCEVSNAHAQTVQPQPHSAGVTNTLTLPAGGDQEIVGTTATQTLTNKSIVATQLTGTIADARFPSTLPAISGANLTNLPSLPLTGGAMTGAITTNSTFDGRDVATDGSKLDGIEAGANVTDAGNVNPLVDSHVNLSTASSGQLLSYNGSDYAWVSAGGGGDLLAANNLSDLANAATARTNLGFNAAVDSHVNLSTASSGQLLSYNGSDYAWVSAGGGGDLIAANNLSDVANASTSRTNLGLAIGSNVQAYSSVLAATTASYTTALNTKLSGIEASADVTDTANVVASLTAGTNITIANDGTIAASGGGGGGAALYSANESSPAAQPSASGGNAVAIGDSAISSGDDAISLGISRATGTHSFAAVIANSGSTLGARGPYSIAMGYEADTGSSSQGAVAIGFDASAGANYAIALGRSVSSGADSFAAAIANGSSSYGASGANGIAIGKQAKATATSTIAIGESSTGATAYGIAVGYQANASGAGAIAIGNQYYVGQTTASGGGSIAIGDDAKATQKFATAIGSSSSAAIIGKYAYAGGRFAATGDSQGGQFILRADTTDATATVLTTNNSAAAATNQIVAASDTCIMFSGTLVAMQNGAQDQGGWEIKGLLKNDGGTTTLVNSNIQTFASGNGWVVALTADNTNNALAVTCTGEASHNIRWVANISTSEVTYA